MKEQSVVCSTALVSFGRPLNSLSKGVTLILAPGMTSTTLRAHTNSTLDAGKQEFANGYLPENLPDPEITSYFPQEWKTYGSTAARNPVFPLHDSEAVLAKGMAWSIADAGASMLDGIAYVPYHSGDIAAIRTSDGKLLGQKHIGGSFGPSSPVIVGRTLYVSNVYGWVTAIPVKQILAEGAQEKGVAEGKKGAATGVQHLNGGSR